MRNPHIVNIEKSNDPDNDPEDLAEEFLEFVKKRAGLLIEVGDNKYSFIHLTFQEYLTSSYIITTGEKDGSSGIWKIIMEHCNDPRWHEVIRLLIAGLKSNESQKILIENILSECKNGLQMTRSLLLGGLLLDGIEYAEESKEEIIKHLLYSGGSANDIEQLRHILSMLRTWIKKDNENEVVLEPTFKSLLETTTDDKQRISLSLIAATMNWPETKIVGLSGDILIDESRDASLFKLFLSEQILPLENLHSLAQSIKLFWTFQYFLSLDNPYGNFVAAIGQAVNNSLGTYIIAKRAFEEQMVVLGSGLSSGPFFDFTLNGLQMAFDDQTLIHRWAWDRDMAQDRARARNLALGIDRSQVRNQGQDLEMTRDKVQNLNPVLNKALAHIRGQARDREKVIDRDQARDWALAKAWDQIQDQAQALDVKKILADLTDLSRDRIQDRTRDRNLDRARALDQARARALTQPQNFNIEFWQIVIGTPKLYSPLLDLLCSTFVLEPRAQWWEALRVGFLPRIPQRITLYNQGAWKQVWNAFEKDKENETEIYFAAWQLLFDTWLYIFGYYKSPDESIFSHLADITREIDAPPLRIAHCIRDLAYGDESRINELVSMVKSENPQYRTIFESCLWRPAPKKK